MGREDGGGKPPHEGGITPDEAKRLGDLLTGPDAPAADPLGLGSPPPPGMPQVQPTPFVSPPKAAQPPKPPTASPGASRGAMDDHERIGREALQQEGHTLGGVTDADIKHVAEQLVEEDEIGLLDRLRYKLFFLRLGGFAMALAGIFLMGQALQDRGLVTTPGPSTAAPATLVPAATTAATSTPIPTAARPATPLSAGPVVATQSGTATSYIVEDLKGDGLRFDWRHSATCASHSGEATATYSWDHPHPPCPDEPFHTSFITVQITDASGQALVRQYTLGSRPGRGQVPAGGGVFTPQTPSPTTVALSPTPFPTTTTRPATGTPAPTASPATGTAGGPNLPLALFGGLLTLGGLGVAWRGPLILGGPHIRKEAPKDPCEREKEREAATRARLAAARSRMDRISSLADSQRQTAQDAEAKARAAEQSKVGAGYGEVDGVRHYLNNQQAARIAAAEAASGAAREAAARAKAAFDAAGGQGELGAAQDELYKANRDWELANESLQRCLQLFAPPPPTPPTAGGTSTGGGTATGGGIGPGGPVVAGGPSGGTMVRPQQSPCPDPPERIVSERELQIWVADMSTTKISNDADRKSYIDLEATLAWARGLRGGLKRAGQATRLAPDVKSAMGPMGPILGFTGMMTDAALNGVDQLGERLQSYYSGGTYSVTFTRHNYTLRCRVKEHCDNGRWTRQPSEFTAEEGAADENAPWGGHPERDQVIGGYRSDIRGQVDVIMRRLFRTLAEHNRSVEREAKRFEEECARS